MGIYESSPADITPKHGLYLAVPLILEKSLVHSLKAGETGARKAVAADSIHTSLLFASDAAVPVSQCSPQELMAIGNEIVEAFAGSGVVGQTITFPNPTVAMLKGGIGIFAKTPPVIAGLRQTAAEIITNRTGVEVQAAKTDDMHVKLYDQKGSNSVLNWRLGSGSVQAMIGTPAIVNRNNVGPREFDNRKKIEQKPKKPISRRSFF